MNISVSFLWGMVVFMHIFAQRFVSAPDELMDIDGEDSGTKVTRANYLRIVLGGSDQGVMMLACKALGVHFQHEVYVMVKAKEIESS
jgi:hypothetical protein